MCCLRFSFLFFSFGFDAYRRAEGTESMIDFLWWALVVAFCVVMAGTILPYIVITIIVGFRDLLKCLRS